MGKSAASLVYIPLIQGGSLRGKVISSQPIDSLYRLAECAVIV